MAEELAFARKASGLTRGLSIFDGVIIGTGNIMPTYAVWFALMFTTAVFYQANLFISLAIIAVALGITTPIVWGTLSASMPRSGGDYVYNTRIMNPAYGMAASMGMFCGQALWNVVQSTWVANPSLTMLGQFLGWPWLVEFTQSKSGVITFGCITWIVVFLICAFGMKVFQTVMRPAFLFVIGATAFAYLPFFWVSKQSFIDRFNEAAAQHGSLNYTEFIAAVQAAAGHSLGRLDVVGQHRGDRRHVPYRHVGMVHLLRSR